MVLTRKQIEIIQQLLTSEQLRMDYPIKTTQWLEYSLDELDEIYFILEDGLEINFKGDIEI